ncbi:MAG: LysR substrate-binding domain-containing protein, partial [Acidobacteriota bacterium]|nr:LysR substrate-binding domain-containing protein [Acidobacteriota bacterium]
RLASLEEVWGTRLFRRGARGMTLTPEGARLLPRAEAVLGSLEDLERAAGVPVAGPGQVRVGAGDALGRALLPRALRKLLRETPGLGVRILEGPGSRLLEALRRGEIDLALVVFSDDIPDDVDAERVLESEVDLLLPRGRPLRGRHSVSARVLDDEPVVTLQPGSRFREHLESSLTRLRVAFDPAVEVGNLSLVRRFVSAGLGVGPVPAVAFPPGEPGPNVERRRLRDVPAVGYYRVVRRGVPLPPPTLRLVELLSRAPHR